MFADARLSILIREAKNKYSGISALEEVQEIETLPGKSGLSDTWFYNGGSMRNYIFKHTQISKTFISEIKLYNYI